MTAHYLTYSAYKPHKDSIVLIHAGGGGVGQLLIQLSKKLGAFVITTVSTQEKANIAYEAGADEVILYQQDDFEVATKRITNNKLVDVVYDSVGYTTFKKSLNCIKPRGYMILFGQSSGPVQPIDPQILNSKGSLYLTRPTLAHYITNREELLWRSNDLFNWMNSGEIRLRIDKEFSLRDAATAHDYMEGRNTKGKVLLIP